MSLAYSEVEQGIGKGVRQRIQLPVRQVNVLEENSLLLGVTLSRARQHLSIGMGRILKRWTEQLRLQMGMIG